MLADLNFKFSSPVHVYVYRYSRCSVGTAAMSEPSPGWKSPCYTSLLVLVCTDWEAGALDWHADCRLHSWSSYWRAMEWGGSTAEGNPRQICVCHFLNSTCKNRARTLGATEQFLRPAFLDWLHFFSSPGDLSLLIAAQPSSLGGNTMPWSAQKCIPLARALSRYNTLISPSKRIFLSSLTGTLETSLLPELSLLKAPFEPVKNYVDEELSSILTVL